MTERDLKRLKDLPVPAPRDEAKRAALNAAMAAFEQQQSYRSNTQGSEADARPNSASHSAVGRKFMTFTRSQYALAASIAALMIAAPMAFQLMQREELGQPGAAWRTFSSKETATSDGANTLAKTASDKDAGANTSGSSLARAPQATNPSAPPSEPRIATLPPPPPASGTATKPRADKPDAPLAAKLKSAQSGVRVSEEKKAEADRQLHSEAPAAIAPLSPNRELGAVGGLDASRQGGLMGARAVFDGRARVAKSAESFAPVDLVDRAPPVIDREYRDKFDAKEINPVKQVAAEPVSTFSIDVDTASYAFVRRTLNAGQLPPKDAVRAEELINYFPYDYAKPETAETPFKPTVTVLPSPWNTANQLVHVAIKGYDLQSTERPRANLVFLMDVSGSMQPADKLPLVKNAFRMLVEELKPDDTVAIVTYASGSGVLLEPTKISDKSKILAAIERLGAGGSTAGAEGIQDAYRLAQSNFDRSAVNRVILATDGDFNVGITDQEALKGLIERKREAGVFLSILGVGEGNYNDSLMQTLAQNGNGTASYVDTLNEARKVLVDEASSTLFTIAKDVKIQIEWNPARVQEYRLIGYETRALRQEDFNNDKVDAGDIGSGHTVTAIYEVTPAGAAPLVDDLRYANKSASPERAAAAVGGEKNSELGFLKLRYKLPKEDASKLVSLPITSSLSELTAAPAEARFSVAVAAFAQLLKGAPYLKNFTYDDVITLAQPARGEDKFGYRAEFINLVRLAKTARP